MARRKTIAKRRPAKSRRRVAPKKRFLFLPWPAIVFLMLCVGVLLAGWTFMAGADDIHVSAKVSAPLPSGPATIITPTDGQHFTSVPITVTGTCPSDGSGAYIKLYRNDVFSGSAICTAGNQFSLQTDLFPEANKLKAVIFNSTDDAGPDSNTPVVFYDVPATVPQPFQATPANPKGIPFLINGEFKVTGYSVGQSGKWKLIITGGNPPYAINIEWGDGQSTLISRKTSGPFIIDHTYKKVGNQDNSSYVIKIKGTDGDGRQAFLQLFVIIKPHDAGPIASTLQRLPPPKHWLWVAWPAYLILLLMMLSYYLGEREEFLVLRKRGWLRQRRG
jgi:hypothetical protein